MTFGDLELIRSATAASGSTAARCSASCRSRCGRSGRPPTSATASGSAMRPLLVRGEQTMIIDAGIGDKMDAKSVEIYAIDRTRNLDHALAEAGLRREDIDIVLASHLHFDHAGGFTRATAPARLSPAFPRARYVVRTARVGGRDASARAEPRELPGGELRAAGGRRRPGPRRRRRRDHARRARRAHRRPHDASSDRR